MAAGRIAQLNIYLNAVTDGLVAGLRKGSSAVTAFGKQLERLKATLGNRGGLKDTLETFRGGAYVAGLTLAGRALNDMADAAKKASDQLNSGEKNASEVTGELLRQLPVYGEIIQAGNTIGDLLFGHADQVAKVTKQLEKQTAEMQRQAEIRLGIQDTATAVQRSRGERYMRSNAGAASFGVAVGKFKERLEQLLGPASEAKLFANPGLEQLGKDARKARALSSSLAENRRRLAVVTRERRGLASGAIGQEGDASRLDPSLAKVQAGLEETIAKDRARYEEIRKSLEDVRMRFSSMSDAAGEVVRLTAEFGSEVLDIYADPAKTVLKAISAGYAKNILAMKEYRSDAERSIKTELARLNIEQTKIFDVSLESFVDQFRSDDAKTRLENRQSLGDLSTARFAQVESVSGGESTTSVVAQQAAIAAVTMNSARDNQQQRMSEDIRKISQQLSLLAGVVTNTLRIP